MTFHHKEKTEVFYQSTEWEKSISRTFRDPETAQGVKSLPRVAVIKPTLAFDAKANFIKAFTERSSSKKSHRHLIKRLSSYNDKNDKNILRFSS